MKFSITGREPNGPQRIRKATKNPVKAVGIAAKMKATGHKKVKIRRVYNSNKAEGK